MEPVSDYCVGAVGGEPSYVFGGGARDSDRLHAVSHGWLPLTLVEFAGPGVAVAGDIWLTAPLGGSDRSRRVVAGDVVTVQHAAGELVAHRDCGLTAFTNRPADLSSDGPLWASSVAVWVADDLAAHVGRLRTAPAAFVECVDRVEQQRAVLDLCRSSPSGDSPVRRHCGRAVRDLYDEQRRLHLLLEAAVRVRIFDPAVGCR